MWLAMQTQWRVAAGGLGYLGLDYNALPEVWRRTGVKKRRRRDAFNALRDMELAALPVMNQAEG